MNTERIRGLRHMRVSVISAAFQDYPFANADSLFIMNDSITGFHPIECFLKKLLHDYHDYQSIHLLHLERKSALQYHDADVLLFQLAF